MYNFYTLIILFSRTVTRILKKKISDLGLKTVTSAKNTAVYSFQKSPALISVSEYIEQYKVQFFNDGRSETSWKGDYWKIFKRLPQDVTLTVEVLEQVILSTPPNTKTRKRACMAIAALARFAQLEYNPSDLSGNYSPNRVSPRDLPDDLTIAQWWYKITNPGWRWVYGMNCDLWIKTP